MIDFFIALFGGLFIGSKIISDKALSKAYSIKEKQRSIISENMSQKVEASIDLENEVKQYLICGKNRDEIYKELQKDLSFITGSDDKHESLFYIPHGYLGCKELFYKPYSTTYWAYQLLLSHRGKISSEGFWFGYHLGNNQVFERNKRICQRIEENIKEGFGTDIYLCLQPGARDDKYRWDPNIQPLKIECEIIDESNKKMRLW